jgi:predicted DNA-binding transcriptional regulator AlpA
MRRIKTEQGKMRIRKVVRGGIKAIFPSDFKNGGKVVDNQGPEPLITPQQLADLLNVPVSWIYERTRIAERIGFPVIKLGKYCRFRYTEVLSWAKEQHD